LALCAGTTRVNTRAWLGSHLTAFTHGDTFTMKKISFPLFAAVALLSVLRGTM
jgi:hypothetical protein